MPEQLLLIGPDPCAFCGAPAEFDCDFVLGFEIEGFVQPDNPNLKPYPVMGMESEIFTCDTPFCRACGVNVGNVFWDGTDNRGARVGDVETVDHCRLHKDEGMWTERSRPTTAAELEEARRKIRMAVTRLRLARVRETA